MEQNIKLLKESVQRKELGSVVFHRTSFSQNKNFEMLKYSIKSRTPNQKIKTENGERKRALQIRYR